MQKSREIWNEAGGGGVIHPLKPHEDYPSLSIVQTPLGGPTLPIRNEEKERRAGAGIKKKKR